MKERVLVSSPTNRRFVDAAEGEVAFTVKYTRRGSSGSVTVVLDMDDDPAVMKARYRVALAEALRQEGLTNAVVIREDAIFGAEPPRVEVCPPQIIETERVVEKLPGRVVFLVSSLSGLAGALFTLLLQ